MSQGLSRLDCPHTWSHPNSVFYPQGGEVTVHPGCGQHRNSTWTPGVVTELFGDLSREALPAELFNLQDPEKTLEFSDSGAKPRDPLRSGMKGPLLSIRATPGSRLLVWVPEASSEKFRLWSVSKVLTLHILVSCLSSLPAASAWACSQY